MAYYRKLPSGKTRAEIDLLGVRKSDSFPTKAEARAWATAEEAAIRAGSSGQFPARTLREAIEKYSREVSSKKKGGRWEQLRLAKFLRDNPRLAEMQFAKVDTPHMAEWRDRRLKEVSKGSVQREINLLSPVFWHGVNEWKWRAGSPFTTMGQPGDNPPRRRRTYWPEIKAICRWLGWRSKAPETKMQEVAFAYLLALRTAMRAGEILQLGDHNVDFKRRVATVEHKTQHATGQPREVPILPPAFRLLKLVEGRGAYFTVTPASREALFRKATKALLIEDLTFHDSRAEVLTRLSRKVDVMTLARISGHKDLRILMETYYREDAADIAARVSASFRRGRQSGA